MFTTVQGRGGYGGGYDDYGGGGGYGDGGYGGHGGGGYGGGGGHGSIAMDPVSILGLLSLGKWKLHDPLFIFVIECLN